MKINTKLIGLLLLTQLSLFGVEVGDTTKEFSLPLLSQNKDFNSQSVDNSVYLLNIWAQWCKGCKAEMPLFDKIAQKYAKDGFKIIAVNIDSKEKKAVKFVKKLENKLQHKSHIVFVYDQKKSLAKYYDAKVIPISLLIKNGKIEKVFMGSFSDEKELSQEIERLLK